MLKQLMIRNLAVIEELELSFSNGMTVFTGETGAGKSILVDALGLVLGDRADSGIIRDGSDRTEISASFDTPDIPELRDVLEEQAISLEDNELMLRRVVNNDGRSRAFVNGTPVPAGLLRQLGEHLVDIHGQHAHQSLMKRDAQRILLDDFGGHAAELDRVNRACGEWHELQDNINQLSGNTEDHRARQNLLAYQVEELENLAPEENEYEALNDEFRRLDNASRIIELVQKSLQVIREDEYSAGNMLAATVNDLQEALQFDEGLANAVELVDSAAIQLGEAGDEIRHYLDQVDTDPERLQNVEQRLGSFHEVARKHDIPSSQVYELLQELQQQLSQLNQSEGLLEELLQKREACLEEYRLASHELHERRVNAAARISESVTSSLAELGMSGSRFVVKVEKLSTDEKPLQNGSDDIDFLVSANPGQAPQALRKVASGGELSRISLAIQVISNNSRLIPTLVFDEVDAGIGGATAEIVGKLLQSLAPRHQVFCVTHLAQVASLANNHLQVQKSSSSDSTVTEVTELDESERIEEIARMLGGIQITEQSREHAREMLLH